MDPKAGEKLPDQRVFRPASDNMNMLINRVLDYHYLQGDIPAASWTRYIEWVLNNDIAQIQQKTAQKLQGLRR